MSIQSYTYIYLLLPINHNAPMELIQSIQVIDSRLFVKSKQHIHDIYDKYRMNIQIAIYNTAVIHF